MGQPEKPLQFSYSWAGSYWKVGLEKFSTYLVLLREFLLTKVSDLTERQLWRQTVDNLTQRQSSAREWETATEKQSKQPERNKGGKKRKEEKRKTEPVTYK